MEIKKFNGVKFRVISVIIFSISVLSCSITKYVPDNSSLLKSVKFKDNNTKLTNSELHAYLLQKPNSYIVGLVPFSLGMYSMSGRDTTKLIKNPPQSRRTARDIGYQSYIRLSTIVAAGIRE